MYRDLRAYTEAQTDDGHHAVLLCSLTPPSLTANSAEDHTTNRIPPPMADRSLRSGDRASSRPVMFSKDGKVRALPTAFCVTNRYQPLPARVAHPRRFRGLMPGTTLPNRLARWPTGATARSAISARSSQERTPSGACQASASPDFRTSPLTENEEFDGGVAIPVACPLEPVRGAMPMKHVLRRLRMRPPVVPAITTAPKFERRVSGGGTIANVDALRSHDGLRVLARPEPASASATRGP